MIATLGARVTATHLSGEFVLHSFVTVDDLRLALLVRPEVAAALEPGATPRMADQWFAPPSTVSPIEERHGS